jgi:hypothetical protein
MRKLIVDDSSQIKEIEFDEAHDVMYITFSNRSVYEYTDIHISTFAELCGAPSIGGAFSKIKGGLKHRKLR